MPATSRRRATPTAVKGAKDASGDDRIGRILDEYLLEKRIGQGGMGEVYAARHRLIGKRAAVKILDRGLAKQSDILRRFINEARAANEARNEHIVDVFGYGTTDEGEPYIIMERCEGEDLRSRLERLRSLPWPQALSIAAQILDALVSAHRNGIVHRDLKPENIMLVPRSGQDFVKILDFGIAKLQRASDEHATSAGIVLGTLSYMSPEQTRGESIDGRCDVFAVGTLLYEMLTGKNPFDAATVPESLYKLREAPLKAVDQIQGNVPAEVSAFVTRLLTRDMRLRPRAALALAELRQIARLADVRLPSGQLRAPSTSGPGVALDTLERAVGEVGTKKIQTRPPRLTDHATAMMLRRPGVAWAVGGVAAALGAIAAVSLVLFLRGAPGRTGTLVAARDGARDAASATSARDGAGAGVPASVLVRPPVLPPLPPLPTDVARVPVATARSIDEAEVADALDRVDTAPCRTKEASEVVIRGHVGRDGVPFDVVAELIGGSDLSAECMKRTVEVTRLPATADGTPLPFMHKFFVAKKR